MLDQCLTETLSVYPTSKITVSLFEGITAARNTYPNINFSERLGNSSNRRYFSKLKTLLLLLICWVAILFPRSRLEKLLPKEQMKTIIAMRTADLVIGAPGGYIHDTNLAYLVALFHIHLSTLLNKSVLLAPQSIGPLDGQVARWLSKCVLGRVPYICTRESYSYNFLHNQLKIPASQIYQTGDSAFWNDRIETNECDIGSEIVRLNVVDKNIFGMTVVGWTFPKSDDPNNAYIRYVSAMANIADYMASRYKLTPVIFNQVTDDLDTAFEVKRRAKYQVIVDEKSHEPEVLRALIKRSVVFVGTRFHSCIFSIMAGRPTFAISYLPKTEFIMNDLQLNLRYAPIDSLNIDYVISQISNDLDHLDTAEARMVEAVEAYQSNFSRLEDVLRLAASRN